MRTICSNSNVSNDILFRQDKDCHQVKMWPPTQQLVIKSIVLNFGLQKEVICLAFRHLGCLDQDLALTLFLCIL